MGSEGMGVRELNKKGGKNEKKNPGKDERTHYNPKV